MISLSWGAATDVGRIRKNNQDSYIADGAVFAVADGMGGHVGGEVASKLAIDVFSEAFSSKPDSLDIISVVGKANSAILSRAQVEPKLQGMGTTLCLLSVGKSGNKFFLNLVNVGDSRGYLYRNGDLIQLTDDHTLVSEMVKAGDLSVSEVSAHRARHILTRALGVDPEVEVDHWKIDPKPQDVYLLCSDGLTNELSDPEIQAILSKPTSPKEKAEELVTGALEAGGSDNVTCIVVQVDALEFASSSSEREETSRIVELPSQAKLRERLQSASRSVGADVGERERYISAAQAQREKEEVAKGERIKQDSSRAVGPAIRVNPLISSGTRSATLTSIPVPLPKRATEKKFTVASVLRIGVFVAILIVVLAFGVSAVGIYANHSYFVGLDKSQVAIYKGRPGGLLWYDPKLVRKTQVAAGQVAPYHLPDLRKGVVEPSLQASLAYVNNLVTEATQITSAPTTTIAGVGTTTTIVAGTGG